MFIRKNGKVVFIFPTEVKFCCEYDSIWTVVYPASSTYNTEFVAQAVSTMNLVQCEFLLCE